MSAWIGIEMWAAKRFGFECAAVLSKALYWDEYAVAEEWHPHDNRSWFEHTIQKWVDDMRGAISYRSMKRHIADLIGSGILRQRHGRGFIGFYSIDHDVLKDARAEYDLRPKAYQKDGKQRGQIGTAESTSGAKVAQQPGQSGTPLPTLSKKRRRNDPEVSADLADASVAVPVPPSPDSSLPNPETKRLERERGPKRPDKEPALVVVPVEALPAVLEPLRQVLKRGTAKPAPSSSEGSQVWEAYRNVYAKCYKDKHGHPIEPVRDAEANTICANLVRRLGLEDAVAVARFFLTCDTRYYVEQTHDLRCLSKDAKTLRTQMKAGRRVTSIGAKQVERHQETREQVLRVTAQMDRDELEKGDSPW